MGFFLLGCGAEIKIQLLDAHSTLEDTYDNTITAKLKTGIATINTLFSIINR